VWVVVPANKLSLQEINQLIRIELLTSSFLENLVLSPNFQGREMPFSTTLRTPMFWCTVSSKLFAWDQCKSTPIIVTLFAFTCSVTMLTCSRNYRKPFWILFAQIAAINLFEDDLDKLWYYLWYCYVRVPMPSLPTLSKGRRGNAPIMYPSSGVPVCRTAE